MTSEAADNIRVVRTVLDALRDGDFLRVLSLVTRDVRWAVNAADRDAAPWFRVYDGRRDLSSFFEDVGAAQFAKIELKALLGQGDLVMSWSDIELTAPTGRRVSMQEVQVWTLRDGRVARVDTLLDTAAVGAAFTGTPQN